jgi:CheY-like chemotaxis protein
MKQKKVLVADSSRLFLELECGYFEKIGCITIAAASAKEALKLAKDERPDLILLDFHLPDMKGADLTKRLKDDLSTRGIPVIMMAADPDREIENKSRDAGAFEFLKKPLKQRHLIYRTASILKISLRFDISVAVSITNLEGGGGIRIKGRSIDMSESGMKLECGLNIEKNAMVRVEFSMPGSPESLQFEGKVMRVEKADKDKIHYGIRFLVPEGRSREQIRDYLSSLSARVGF